MSTKITPSHLPKGSVIKTGLYYADKDGNIFMRHDFQYEPSTARAAEFTVDYVRCCDTMSGRNYIVITSNKKEPPSQIEDDEFYCFHIDHVTQVLSMGKKLDIRYESSLHLYDSEQDYEHGYMGYQLKIIIGKYFVKNQPYNVFDVDKAFLAAQKANVVQRFNYINEEYTYNHDVGVHLFRVNRKKLKKWMKQNINRFIISKAQLQAIEDECNGFEYDCLEPDDTI